MLHLPCFVSGLSKGWKGKNFGNKITFFGTVTFKFYSLKLSFSKKVFVLTGVCSGT